MNKKILLVPALALGLLGTASLAHAWHGYYDGDGPYHGYRHYRGGCYYGDGYYGHGYGHGRHWRGQDCPYYWDYDRDGVADRPGPGPRFRGDVPPPPPAADDAYGPGPRYRDMDLTPEQRAAYDKIVDDFNTKATPLRDKLFVKRAELRALQNAPEPDVQAVSKTAQEILDLRKQLGKLGDEFFKNLEDANLR